MNHYATYFDIHYLSRGLALYDSVKRNAKDEFKLYILCLDNLVWDYFSDNGLSEIELIQLAEIEEFYPKLKQARNTRTLVEYYFTLSPFLPLYLLERNPHIPRITTMDADLYFYSDPNSIIQEQCQPSVLISPHKFSPNFSHLEIFGRYNVSFQSFKNNPEGRACLEHWAAKCLDWCGDWYDEENQRFADQKYLDEWTSLFPGVEEVRAAGAAIAPWNVNASKLGLNGDKFYAGDATLIFYHFHHLRVLSRSMAVHGLEYYQADTNSFALRKLYLDYIRELNKFAPSGTKKDRNIKRANSRGTMGLLKNLRNPDGYWLYYSGIIKHVNLVRKYRELKKSLKGLWQNY